MPITRALDVTGRSELASMQAAALLGFGRYTGPMQNLVDMALPAATQLKARGDTIAVAESSTGGLVAAALLAVPGASAYFKGGSVIYTLASRKIVLGIRKEDVAGIEPLTEAMVLKFASRAREQLDATWGLAELGIAGPTAAYGIPPGRSVIGLVGPVNAATTVVTEQADREANMWQFTQAALRLLDATLADTNR